MIWRIEAGEINSTSTVALVTMLRRQPDENGMQVMPELQGFSHIDLTVSDCEAGRLVAGRDGFHFGKPPRADTFEVWSL